MKDDRLDTINGLWGLGNIHNYDTFVRCAALFSPDLSDRYRSIFSGRLGTFVDASKAFELALRFGAEGMRRYTSMISEIVAGDKFGLFRFRKDASYSGNRDEQRLSLAITDTFSQFLAMLSSLDQSGSVAKGISCCREQFDDCRNPQDFVINRALAGGSLPVVVVEFARDTPRGPNDRKEPQLFQYICNNCRSLPDGKCPLTIGVPFVDLNHRTPTFQIFGYYQVEDNFHVVPITSIVEVDADSLGRLFFVMACFSFDIDKNSLPPQMVGPGEPVLRFPTGTGGVVTIGDARVKVFNYADFCATRIENGGRGRIAPEDRRTARYGVKMLPGAQHVRVSESVDVLIYNNVNGDHEPHHTDCVAACVRHLIQAHNSNIIHCDLHLGNFVFNKDDPGASLIIDWDHARSLDRPGKYVSNWNHELPERHGDAKANRPILMAHERHSLGAVLGRFVPSVSDDAAVTGWQKICEMAADEHVDLSALAARIEDAHVGLQLRYADAVSHIVVTESPPRDGAPAAAVAAAAAGLEASMSDLLLDSVPESEGK